MLRLLLAQLCLVLVSCGPSMADDLAIGVGPVTVLQPLPGAQLGSGDHTAASVTLTEIAGPSSGLRRPRDLAFNPRRPDELWAVNYDDNSVVVVTDASL